jgi:mRNA interferase RelE/StbE
MAHELYFLPEALEEWGKLDGSIKKPLKNALEKRLETPRMPGSELNAPLHDCYKIKLLRAGYRLVYLVRDTQQPPDIVVLVVGRRDGGIYEAAAQAWSEGLTFDPDEP